MGNQTSNCPNPFRGAAAAIVGESTLPSGHPRSVTVHGTPFDISSLLGEGGNAFVYRGCATIDRSRIFHRRVAPAPQKMRIGDAPVDAAHALDELRKQPQSQDARRHFDVAVSHLLLQSSVDGNGSDGRSTANHANNSSLSSQPTTATHDRRETFFALKRFVCSDGDAAAAAEVEIAIHRKLAAAHPCVVRYVDHEVLDTNDQPFGGTTSSRPPNGSSSVHVWLVMEIATHGSLRAAADDRVTARGRQLKARAAADAKPRGVFLSELAAASARDHRHVTDVAAVSRGTVSGGAQQQCNGTAPSDEFSLFAQAMGPGSPPSHQTHHADSPQHQHSSSAAPSHDAVKHGAAAADEFSLFAQALAPHQDKPASHSGSPSRSPAGSPSALHQNGHERTTSSTRSTLVINGDDETEEARGEPHGEGDDDVFGAFETSQPQQATPNPTSTSGPGPQADGNANAAEGTCRADAFVECPPIPAGLISLTPDGRLAVDDSSPSPSPSSRGGLLSRLLLDCQQTISRIDSTNPTHGPPSATSTSSPSIVQTAVTMPLPLWLQPLFSVEEILDVLIDAAAALEHMHAQSPEVVHWDLKLENMLRFGAGHQVYDEHDEHPARSDRPNAAPRCGGCCQEAIRSDAVHEELPRTPLPPTSVSSGDAVTEELNVTPTAPNEGDGDASPEVLRLRKKLQAAVARVFNPPGSYRVCDFGSAVQGTLRADTASEIRVIEALVEERLTAQYRAPEACDVWEKKPLGPKMDTWALGVAVFIMLWGEMPFDAAARTKAREFTSTCPRIAAEIASAFEALEAALQHWSAIVTTNPTTNTTHANATTNAALQSFVRQCVLGDANTLLEEIHGLELQLKRMLVAALNGATSCAAARIDVPHAHHHSGSVAKGRNGSANTTSPHQHSTEHARSSTMPNLAGHRGPLTGLEALRAVRVCQRGVEPRTAMVWGVVMERLLVADAEHRAGAAELRRDLVSLIAMA